MLGKTTTPPGVEPRALRDAIGHFATGVAVVTAVNGTGRPFGTTANAISSVSLQPPLVLACLRLESETLGALRETGAFAINVLAAGQQHLSDRFAKGADKIEWDAIGHRLADGVPVLDDALASLECTLHDTGDGGDHVIVIGRVVSVDHAQGDDPAHPLLFFRGGYGRLGSVPAPPAGPPAATEAEAAARALRSPPAAPTRVPSRLGPLRMLGLTAGETSAAVLVGDPENRAGARLEIHRGCVLGDVLGSLACRGRERLHGSLERLRGAGEPAVLVYVRDGAGACCAGGPRPLSAVAIDAVREAVGQLGLRAPVWGGTAEDAAALRAAGIDLAASAGPEVVAA